MVKVVQNSYTKNFTKLLKGNLRSKINIPRYESFRTFIHVNIGFLIYIFKNFHLSGVQSLTKSYDSNSWYI